MIDEWGDVGRVIDYGHCCSVVEYDRKVPMIEQIDQIMDALLDHDLIASITTLAAAVHSSKASMHIYVPCPDVMSCSIFKIPIRCGFCAH